MILVTGGTGLVGSHLLYQLTANNSQKIRAIYRKHSNLKAVKNIFSYYTTKSDTLFNKIEWIEADITDITSLEDPLKGITTVYHAAAMVSFNPTDNKAMRRTNIEGTINMVNMALYHKVSYFCHISSIATLERTSEQSITNESNEWNPEGNNSGYAISKYGAEMEVWRGIQEGLPAVIVNPGVILGPGFWTQGTGKMFTKIHQGLSFYPTGSTGFVGVQDVVKILILLTEKRITNERFILVSENAPFKKVLNTIAQEFQKPPPSKKLTKWMAELAWRASWLTSLISRKPPLLSKYSARAAFNNYTYSSKKITGIVNFSFEKLTTTIKNTCKFFPKIKIQGIVKTK